MLRVCLAWLAFLMPISIFASESRVTGTDVAEIGLELVVMGGEVVQQVQVTDRAGGVWLAYYAMQRQKDGSWRTNGCHLVQPTRIISA